MIKNERVAALGDGNNNVEYVFLGDFVFFYHVGEGIEAAKGKSGQVCYDEHHDDALYREIEFLTRVPLKEGDFQKAMSISMVREITNKFFLVQNIKVPYLSKSEAESLLYELK